jgi:hypothetical protein
MRRSDPFDLLALLSYVVLLLLSAAGAAWSWFKIRHAYSWPSAQGTIISAQAQKSKGSYIGTWVWVGNLTYTYIVNGEYYSGFHRIRAHTERGAEEKVAGWKGRMVVVRYSPDKPDLSVLLKSDQPGGQLGN